MNNTVERLFALERLIINIVSISLAVLVFAFSVYVLVQFNAVRVFIAINCIIAFPLAFEICYKEENFAPLFIVLVVLISGLVF